MTNVIQLQPRDEQIWLDALAEISYGWRSSGATDAQVALLIPRLRAHWDRLQISHAVAMEIACDPALTESQFATVRTHFESLGAQWNRVLAQQVARNIVAFAALELALIQRPE